MSTAPRHYVAYHNTELMGYGPDEVKTFEVYTNGGIPNVAGQGIWLIGAAGQPRRYFLVLVFKANMVSDRPGLHPHFKRRVSGQQGAIFGDKLELTELDWFRDLQKVHKNFKNGITEITEPRFVEALQRISGVDIGTL